MKPCALSERGCFCVSPDSPCFTPSSFRTQTAGTCRTTSARSSTAGGSLLKSPLWWRWRVGEWCCWNKDNFLFCANRIFEFTSLGAKFISAWLHTCMQEELLKMILPVKGHGMNATKPVQLYILSNIKYIFPRILESYVREIKYF